MLPFSEEPGFPFDGDEELFRAIMPRLAPYARENYEILGRGAVKIQKVGPGDFRYSYLMAGQIGIDEIDEMIATYDPQKQVVVGIQDTPDEIRVYLYNILPSDFSSLN